MIFVLQHITRRRWVEKLRKKNIQWIRRSLERSYPAEVINVDRVQDLEEKNFIKNYLNKGLPVIFSGCANDWPCTMKWSLDFLKSQYPEEEFSLIDSTGLVEQEYDQTKENQNPVFIDKIKAKDFVDKTKAGEKPYLRFCPIMETHPELEQDLDQSWLKKMRRCFLGISYQSFIGPSGRKTPLHSETTAFFYVMADGEKKWTLYSPTVFPLLNPEAQGRGYNFSRFNLKDADESKYPGAKQLHRYECILKKGDILFVPAWMWHEVENITDGWGVSYRMTNLRGFLKHPVFVFIRLFLTKPSFFEILYYSFFKSDIAKRKKNLLTPKIFFKK
jgi:lysine-specific demethylase 8